VTWSETGMFVCDVQSAMVLQPCSSVGPKFFDKINYCMFFVLAAVISN